MIRNITILLLLSLTFGTVTDIDGNMDAGYHTAKWNADAHPSGVYFVKMIAGKYVNTQKLMLIK